MDQDELIFVMSTVTGRAFVWRLLEMASILQNAALAAGFDTNVTMFNTGKQALGNELFLWINRACPEMYVTMMGEAMIRERQRREDEAKEQAETINKGE